jgi:flavin reductase (DIM6/NTAB) family NADH-FMN oxidoreductase RutF
MENLPVYNVFRLIEPGPVLLATTFHNGRPNIMTMASHMMIHYQSPVLIGCIVGPWSYSMTAFRETGECVLAVPGADLVEKAVEIGNVSGDKTDKFREFHLTALPATHVKAPLIGECMANIECKVADASLADKYRLFILEAVEAHIDPERKEQRAFHHLGDGTFVVDGNVVNLQKRMTKWWTFMD